MIRVFLALSLLWTGVAHAESLKESTPNIVVIGEASEEVAPDRATLRFAVVTERPTAVAASTDNGRTIEAILAELKAIGVADKDVQTQGVTLAPFTIEERDSKGKPKGTAQAFRATNSLSVSVKPIEKAGEIVARAIDKGANSLEGIDYDYSRADEKRDVLRAAAVKDAERRARVYAEAAGLRLARVLEIRPLDESIPIARPFEARLAAAPDAAPVPLRPGLQRILERVSIVWAVAR
jgi:uncharacterized protein